jgi:glycosyltransferase involved in cell wall biosynthesis
MYCLSMIVRNESARIERALKSAVPYISSWCILDTGSTDGTPEKIIQFFRDAEVPGELRHGPFEDFGQARNLALANARECLPVYQPKFFLLMDADMELVVRDRDRFMAEREGACYEMFQHAGAVHYTNARLLHVTAAGNYKGPTHEYLNVASAGRIPVDVAYFIDHADGSNRVDKFKRDIELLEKALKNDPLNARYMYYLAASYRDAGEPGKAAIWFKKRIEAAGWPEEVWKAHVDRAHAHKDLGNADGFVAGLLEAYAYRPTRAEAMYDLANWFRYQPGKQAAALACAEAVEHLPKPDDALFVNDYVYEVGVKEEISITAAYVPGKFNKGRCITDELALKVTGYWQVRSCARANMFWYIRPLVEFCPSFKWRNIPFTPPDNLVPMNPSVVLHNQKIFVNVRAVNYRIDNAGRYVITATDGTANAENPIDTRNFILNMGFYPLRDEPINVTECYRPGNMPCEFPLVTGFEDVRLFSWKQDLWCTATVRQIAADGQCEQVLTRLAFDALADIGYRHTDMKRMLRTPRETEKNWSPIQWESAREPLFLWRPGVVVNSDGTKIVDTPVPFMTDNISGSSQLVHWSNGGWLGISHTAHPLPNEPYKRFYYHRFIEYAKDMRVTRMSLPFCFNEQVIEFCGGMCWNAETPLAELVISYGYKDNEARIATVSADEVDSMLERGHDFNTGT